MDCFAEIETGADCPERVVLVRRRIAEQGEANRHP